MRGDRVVCGLAVALLVTACSSGADDPPSNGKPVVAPLTIGEKPLWAGSADFFTASRPPELRGDSLIAFGPGADGSEKNRLLAVADAATGKPRWQVDNGDLTGDDHVRVIGSNVAGDDDEWVVIAPYDPCATRAGCISGDPADQAYGVVALAGADGGVRWKTPIDPNQPVNSIIVGEQLAVSLVRAPCCPDDELDGTRVVATNVSDGAIAWESAGLWPQFVLADTVLGIDAPRLDSLDPLDPEVSGGSTVVALDATTGVKKWDLADRYAKSTVYQALGDVAVIGTADEQDKNRRSRVIDASTGQELADLGAPIRCLNDAENLIVCAGEAGGDITIFDAGEREKSVIPGNPSPNGVRNAWHGYLIRHEDIIDRNGTVVLRHELGLVVAMSDQYLVTYPDLGKDGAAFAVHRVEK